MSNNVYASISIVETLTSPHELRLDFSSTVDVQGLIGKIIHVAWDYKNPRATFGEFVAKAFEVVMQNAIPASIQIVHAESPKITTAISWHPVLSFDEATVAVVVRNSDEDYRPIHFANWESDDDEWLDELILEHNNCSCDSCLKSRYEDDRDLAMDERRLREE